MSEADTTLGMTYPPYVRVGDFRNSDMCPNAGCGVRWVPNEKTTRVFGCPRDPTTKHRTCRLLGGSDRRDRERAAIERLQQASRSTERAMTD
jgi:hypothetical protein